jgi:hypothetical protein
MNPNPERKKENKTMNKKMQIHIILVLALAVAVLGITQAHKSHEQAEADAFAEAAAKEPPRVQLAILLDTSSSMSGLISQAKTQLWKVVNEFITAEQRGVSPIVQIALYEYGNNGLDQETHWIRCISPMSRDLDMISNELFALTTNGGQEYCGAVIERATLDLEWDADPKVFKTIFIAGNEPFTQGPVDVKKACQEAVENGITVNTIHCGAETAGIHGGWKDGAMLADGSFMIIDQNRAVAHIEAPQDKEIAALNTKLNDTYIPFGAKGAVAKREQVAQDENANQFAEQGAEVNRVVAKASQNYYNASWDLVDAVKNKQVDLKDLDSAKLPTVMQKMDLKEQRAFVAENQQRRADIQKQILDLNNERLDYIKKQQKETGGDTLDLAMIEALRSQAGKSGITWEK